MSELEDMIRKIVRDELAKTTPANDAAPTYLTVTEYAKRWSISETTVREAIREKRLDVERVGRAVRIAADATISQTAASANERAVLQLMRGGKVR